MDEVSLSGRLSASAPAPLAFGSVAGAVEEMIDVGGGAWLWTVTEGTASADGVVPRSGPGDGDNLGTVAAMIMDLAAVHRYEQRACGRSSGGSPFTMTRPVEDFDALRHHWRATPLGGSRALVRRRPGPRLGPRTPEADGCRHRPVLRRPPDRSTGLEIRSTSTPASTGSRSAPSPVRGAGCESRGACPRRWRRNSRRWRWVPNSPIPGNLQPVLRRFRRSRPAAHRRRARAASPRHRRPPPAGGSRRPRRRTTPTPVLIRLPSVGHLPHWGAPDLLRTILRGFLRHGSIAGGGPSSARADQVADAPRVAISRVEIRPSLHQAV